jgi:hypothetical protein
MNTIQVTTIQPESNDRITINYTETEVLGFIMRAREVDAIQHISESHRQHITLNREKVRDFFSEGQWDDGEFSASKKDINELLESIGANRLTSKYRATYRITGTYIVDAESADDAEAIFADNVTVDFYDGDIDVDQVEVLDVEEDY